MPVHSPRYRVRQSCRATRLSINTSIGTSVDKAPISLDGHPVRIAEQARSRRLLGQQPTTEQQPPDSVPRAFCQVVRGLSIGFSPGTYNPQTIQPPRPTPTGEYVPFTHVVSIVYPNTYLFGYPRPLGGEIGRIWQTQDESGGLSVLTVVVPPPPFLHLLPPEYKLVPGTSFTEVQLLLIRDFLTLALPMLHAKDDPPPTSKPGNHDPVHVLITAPGPSVLPPDIDVSVSQGAADVVSAVACYFSFISCRRVRSVLRDIHAQFFLDFKRDPNFSHTLTPWMNQVDEEFFKPLEKVAKISSGEVPGLIRNFSTPFYILNYTQVSFFS